MINFIKTLIGKRPPLGKWISYQEYVERWRDEYSDEVEIIDADNKGNVKLKLK